MSGKRTGKESLAAFYAEQARAAGVELDAADRALIHDLQATTDDIAELDRSIKRDGRVIVSASGSTKVHPGLAAVRNLRVARARLAANIDARIAAAARGATAVRGGQSGVRGVYTGTGEPNQRRAADARARRGRGRTA